VVGICRGRQGGGHRVKMREDPPSGARTLIDFPTSLVPLSSVESSLPPKVIHAHIAFCSRLVPFQAIWYYLGFLIVRTIR